MRDIYTESVVPAAQKPLHKALYYLLLVLAGLSVLGIFAIGMVFLIPAGLFGLLLYRNMQKAGGEYEYVHTNSVFDVDLVIANSRRKQLISVDLEHVLLVAPADSQEAGDYGELPELDCSGTGGEGALYAMIYTAEGRRKKLLLRLEPKMQKSLKQWIPGKVR